MRSDVEGGMLLSQAMARHPNAFDRLYISMIEAGEAAGILDTVLDRVAVQIEKEMKIRRRVKGAMIYPTRRSRLRHSRLIGMLLFLVPVFQKIFADLGGDLPTLTKGVVAASDLVRGYWFILFPPWVSRSAGSGAGRRHRAVVRCGIASSCALRRASARSF